MEGLAVGLSRAQDGAGEIGIVGARRARPAAPARRPRMRRGRSTRPSSPGDGRASAWPRHRPAAPAPSWRAASATPAGPGAQAPPPLAQRSASPEASARDCGRAAPRTPAASDPRGNRTPCPSTGAHLAGRDEVVVVHGHVARRHSTLRTMCATGRRVVVEASSRNDAPMLHRRGRVRRSPRSRHAGPCPIVEREDRA